MSKKEKNEILALMGIAEPKDGRLRGELDGFVESFQFFLRTYSQRRRFELAELTGATAAAPIGYR